MARMISITHVDTLDLVREQLAAIAAMVGACTDLHGREIQGLASLLDGCVFALDRIAEGLVTEDPTGHGGRDEQ